MSAYINHNIISPTVHSRYTKAGNSSAMEFPFDQSSHSHTHHTHHNRRSDEDDPNYDGSETYPPPGRSTPFSNFDQPPPPGRSTPFSNFDQPPPPQPPSNFYGQNYPSPPQQPPRAHVTHVSHSSHPSPYPSYEPPISQDLSYSAYPPPPRPDYSSNYESEPARVQHVSHDVVGQQPFGEESVVSHQDHHFRPHLPSFGQHHTHQSDTASFDLSDLRYRPTFKIYCKADHNLSLAIRDGRVILASADPSDPFQHWYKDERFSTKVKDEEGFPCFALVNKATGEAIKHSIGATHPVQLIPYNPNILDQSVLWTESKDTGEGFRTIRMVNNIRLNVDAFYSDKNHNGVHDGTTIGLWGWKKGENQRWKIVPY